MDHNFTLARLMAAYSPLLSQPSRVVFNEIAAVKRIEYFSDRLLESKMIN